jgi:hypothetical protein
MTNIIKQFIKKFFSKNNITFYILRTEVDIKELIEQLNTLKKIFRESLKIPLRIDPRILELCKSGKDSKKKSSKYLKKYFTNEKKNKFRELYNRTNSLLTNKNGINMSTLLRMSSKSNNKIDEYLTNGTNSELKIKLISEIRLRKFAIECGFETWGQLKNMFRLFKYIYKNRFEKYFDFNTDINNNGNSNNNGNNGNNNNNDNRNNNNNDNRNYIGNELWTNNKDPRSEQLRKNKIEGANRTYTYFHI